MSSSPVSAPTPVDIVAAALARSGRATLRVRGTSMHPFLPGGAMVRITAARRVRRGDVAVRPGLDGAGLLVHRVVAVSAAGVTTRGDALDHDDPPVTRDQLLGTVTAVAPRAFPDGLWLPTDGAIARLFGRLVGAALAPALRRLRKLACVVGVRRGI